MQNKSKSGFALIEVLIAVSIISGALIAIVALTSQSLNYARVTLKNYQATLATEEAVEAIKAIRNENWDTNIATLVSGTEYGISLGNTNWQIVATPQETDLGFTRTILVTEAYRDANDDLASTGTLDAGTRKVRIDTDWEYQGKTYNQNIEFYISDIFD